MTALKNKNQGHEGGLDNQSKSCEGHFNIEFIGEPEPKSFIKSLEELIKELLDE